MGRTYPPGFFRVTTAMWAKDKVADLIKQSEKGE